MGDKGYSGWTNYATWVANLELVDQLVGEPDALARDIPEPFDDAYDLSMYIKEVCREYVLVDENTTVARWAEIALDQVNWLEIAEHMVEDTPALLVGEGDDEEED